MLSVLIAWTLIGFVVASLGGKVFDATGAGLFRDLWLGAAGSLSGGVAFILVEMSNANSLRPVGLAASLVGAVVALAGGRALIARRSPH
jgi:uncharacterized membrane protein YeaQ/YmgE (transglycosylase-associated protein family)